MELMAEAWRPRDRARFRGATGFVLVVGFSSLVGCADIPDELNPVEWYEGVVGWFEDDEVREAGERAKESARTGAPVPGAEQPFPNLASVPPRPKRVASTEQRKKAAAGLVADREHARYADLDVRGGEAVTPAPARRAPVAAAPIAPPAPPPAGLSPSAKFVAAPPVAPPSARVAALPPQPAPAPARPRAGVTAPPPAGLSPSAKFVAAPPVAPPSARVAALPPQPALAPARPRAGVTAPPSGRKFHSLAEFDDNAAAVSFQAATLRFPRGSAKLNAKHRSILREVVTTYREHGGTLRVIGHASGRTRNLDPAIREKVNLRISFDRANAVAKELVRLGVRSDKLFVGGRSDREPVYHEFMPAGEAGNQRAEIYIDY